MRNLKKRIVKVLPCLISAILLCSTCLMLSTPAAAATNLLQNGDLSQGNGSAVDGWDEEIFAGSGSITHTVTGEDAPYVTIKTNEPSDYRLKQTINAEANKTYKYSGYVRAEGINDKNESGAILSVPYSTQATDSYYNTKGKWKKVVMYIKTNPEKIQFDVSIGVGGHSSLNQGTASFKDLKLELYEGKLPGDAIVCNMDEFTKNDAAAPAAPPSSGKTNVWLVVIIIIVVLGIALYFVLFTGNKPKNDDNDDDSDDDDDDIEDDDDSDDDSDDDLEDDELEVTEADVDSDTDDE